MINLTPLEWWNQLEIFSLRCCRSSGSTKPLGKTSAGGIYMEELRLLPRILPASHSLPDASLQQPRSDSVILANAFKLTAVLDGLLGLCRESNWNYFIVPEFQLPAHRPEDVTVNGTFPELIEIECSPQLTWTSN